MLQATLALVVKVKMGSILRPVDADIVHARDVRGVLAATSGVDEEFAKGGLPSAIQVAARAGSAEDIDHHGVGRSKADERRQDSEKGEAHVEAASSGQLDCLMGDRAKNGDALFEGRVKRGYSVFVYATVQTERVKITIPPPSGRSRWFISSGLSIV
jgi:hypothetical protein